MVEEVRRPAPIEPLTPPKKGLGKLGPAATATVLAMLAGLYAVEGGYVNDKSDRGGETNFGVTKQVARQAGYNGPMRGFLKHCVQPGDVCADEIYFERYLEKPGFVPVLMAEPAVAEELFDTGVNMGPYWPSLWFQQALRELDQREVVADGKVGQQTVAAYRELQRRLDTGPACVAVLDKLDAKQAARYRSIAAANPSQRKFLKGWLNNRIGNVDRAQCGKGVG